MLRPHPLRDVVLIVDDAPENLSILHSLLDKSGYMVLVATDGARALDCAHRLPPDLILLDAVMPGMDGFETCRRLKEDFRTRPIPVLFMTGLAETEHVLQGFQAGGVDYIPKPIRPAEVIVRIASHLRNSRLIVQTRAAIDAAGQAVVAVAPNGEVLWLTPLAQSRLRGSLDVEGRLPAALCDWLHGALRASEDRPFELLTASEELIVSRLRRGAHGEELLMIQCKVGSPEPAALMQAFRLTPREADVLYWVAAGKTNRDIADILGMSPRTANKHLEHVFEKLGVETRTTAARMALNLVTPHIAQ
ncbi:response regulator transcription factor [Paraburkholderia rhynchosiae]|uniref:DNA-binding response regulator n=2 Tax=Paraburkholderia rhynchosiae TaxID=487049 RepID=A0A2N7W050_9BURK|nr:response regulator transcription factor [Paraburkholderia rhynchosiae]PMS22789.1 DNA-binding response regulator [Paraburkholderia rhynchosiae]CAB3741097.1 Protein-glutamate methylesterase/protein-glutamine glutaminase [Paraburkholderia rhynchosiae]